MIIITAAFTSRLNFPYIDFTHALFPLGRYLENYHQQKEENKTKMKCKLLMLPTRDAWGLI